MTNGKGQRGGKGGERRAKSLGLVQETALGKFGALQI